MGELLTITKRFGFEAHHRLPWHDGKCARDHGHSYALEVSVRGPVKPDDGAPDSGMVCDFSAVKAAVKPMVDGALDHWSLNALCHNPTAENVVLKLLDTLPEAIPAGLQLVRLVLWETADSRAEWEGVRDGRLAQ